MARPQGLKPQIILASLTYGLKPVPFKLKPVPFKTRFMQPVLAGLTAVTKAAERRARLCWTLPGRSGCLGRRHSWRSG